MFNEKPTKNLREVYKDLAQLAITNNQTHQLLSELSVKILERVGNIEAKIEMIENRITDFENHLRQYRVLWHNRWLFTQGVALISLGINIVMVFILGFYMG